MKVFFLVPGVRGSQPDHSGRQHLPHRLFPRRTLHEVRTEQEHKGKHRQWVFRYGSQVLKYLSHDQVARSDLPNPMCTVFPTVTRYGHRILLFIILNHVHFIKKNLTEHRTNLSNCFISFRKYIETHILSLCISVLVLWGCVCKLCIIYWLSSLFAITLAWPSPAHPEKFIILVADNVFIRCIHLIQ